MKVSGEIGGSEARWVLSLMERHYTIYLTEEIKGLKLYFQDPDTAVVGTILLTDTDVVQWREILRAAASVEF